MPQTQQSLKNQGVFVKHYSMPPAAIKSKQELSEDNEVRREATKYELQHLVYVIQSSRSRSLGQKLWYDMKGLVTRNTHVKYESPVSHGS